MRKRRFALALVMLVIAASVLPTVAAAQSPAGGGVTVPITGKGATGGKVTGTFTILRFVDNGGQLGAFGTLAVKNGKGDTSVTQVVMPVQATSRPAAGGATSGVAIAQVCEVLDLVLGPLDLNLAGLEVHLDTVHLLIEANPAGGLLGQLLAGLLCGVDLGGILGNLTALVTFLNNLIALLNGIGL